MKTDYEELYRERKDRLSRAYNLKEPDRVPVNGSFGYFAAKLDDIANFIPSRLTSLLMVTCCMSPRGFAFIIKYGNKHVSPNAGYPEAALAGILNCRLGGPGKYENIMVYKPYIGKIERTISSKDIKKAVFTNHLTTLSAIFIISILLYNTII